MSITPEENFLADEINAALAALIGCVCEEVDPVCACGIIVGEDFVEIESEDTCSEEECSQAWVQVTNAYPTTSVGEQTIEINPDCGVMMGLDITVGLIRCIDVPKDGEVYERDTLLEASVQGIRDMTALRKAIMCCAHFPDYVVGNWTPVGMEGGQYGGFWTISVTI